MTESGTNTQACHGTWRGKRTHRLARSRLAHACDARRPVPGSIIPRTRQREPSCSSPFYLRMQPGRSGRATRWTSATGRAGRACASIVGTITIPTGRSPRLWRRHRGSPMIALLFYFLLGGSFVFFEKNGGKNPQSDRHGPHSCSDADQVPAVRTSLAHIAETLWNYFNHKNREMDAVANM